MLRVPTFTSSPDVDGLDGLDGRDEARIAWLMRWLKPLLWRWFRPEVRGLSRIPAGPALLVGNHNGALLMPDTFILGAALYERFGLEGLPYGLGHSTGIALPVLKQVFVPLGAVRGSPDNGARLLSAGRKVLVYPGGELDSMRAYRDRQRVIFGRRRGYLRLALRAGVPVVPVVAAGAHETLLILHDGQPLARWLGLDRFLRQKTWPVVLCLPWGLWVGVPPPHLPWPSRILIEALPPLSFDRCGPEAADDRSYVEQCHARVHHAMESGLRRLSLERAGPSRST